MDLVYLDQNKWIELARVQAGSVSSGPIADLYSQLLGAVESNQVLFPLSASHVLETSKRNDPKSRGHLVETQAKLSRGFAYRSRAGRLEVEVRTTLNRLFGIEQPELPRHWAIAHGFLQAFEPMDASIASPAAANHIARINALVDPALQYVEYMNNQDDSRRREVHAALAVVAADQVARMEARRALLDGESVDMRRRAYSVQLFLEHQETFLRILASIDRTFEQFKSLGERGFRALIEEVPTLNVEAAMAARLESETGPLKVNDLFDMQSFYTAIPYSCHVIAEKASISRARQAKLGVLYNVKLSKSLNDLLNVYPLSSEL